MRWRRYHALLLSLIILVGCGRGEQAPARVDQPQTGGMLQMANFDYRVQSGHGEELVAGTLIIPWPMQQGQVVRGTWEARYVGPRTATQPAGDPSQIGPQVGHGTLTAERENDELRINLNPNMNDNNVMLIGTISGDESLSGRWEYITFVGVTSGGVFQARKQP